LDKGGLQGGWLIAERETGSLVGSAPVEDKHKSDEDDLQG